MMAMCVFNRNNLYSQSLSQCIGTCGKLICHRNGEKCTFIGKSANGGIILDNDTCTKCEQPYWCYKELQGLIKYVLSMFCSIAFQCCRILIFIALIVN